MRAIRDIPVQAGSLHELEDKIIVAIEEMACEIEQQDLLEYLYKANMTDDKHTLIRRLLLMLNLSNEAVGFIEVLSEYINDNDIPNQFVSSVIGDEAYRILANLTVLVHIMAHDGDPKDMCDAFN
jgi:hypothetical protein